MAKKSTNRGYGGNDDDSNTHTGKLPELKKKQNGIDTVYNSPRNEKGFRQFEKKIFRGN